MPAHTMRWLSEWALSLNAPLHGINYELAILYHRYVVKVNQDFRWRAGLGSPRAGEGAPTVMFAAGGRPVVTERPAGPWLGTSPTARVTRRGAGRAMAVLPVEFLSSAYRHGRTPCRKMGATR